MHSQNNNITPRLEDLHPELSANVVSFSRLLRQHDLVLGPDEVRDALQTLQYVDLHVLADFKAALRVTLAKSLKAQEVFEGLFEAFWVNLITKNLKSPERVEVRQTGEATALKKGTKGLPSIKEWGAKARKKQEQQVIAYSPDTILSRKDFSQLQLHNIDEMARLLVRLIRPLAVRESRRHEIAKYAARLNLRRTMRLNLRRGGDLVDLVFQKRRQERMDLVLVCDVSQSMEIYSRFLIGFAFALHKVYRRVDSFVFSTRLYAVTDVLKGASVGTALEAMAERVEDWGSGTRIGESLLQLAAQHRRKLHRRSVVLILSDGWETGDGRALGTAMRRIKQSAHKVVWLNPLMGYPGYRPETEGLKAALPYVDLMAPAHNLESLRMLVKNLAAL